MNTNRPVKSESAEATPKIYLVIWASLLILTAITVTAANLHLGKIAIIVVLLIAVIKSSLVLLYFMHLHYEKRLIIRLLIPGALLVLAIFIGLTYSDLLTR
jgi:cytochrome c oxidase subunit IV